MTKVTANMVKEKKKKADTHSYIKNANESVNRLHSGAHGITGA